MNTPEANNDTLLYQVAKMYYIDGMSQDDVAKSVGFSRSYVSRLIDRAKERRIVTFVVTNPMDHVVDSLAIRLKELFGLRFVAIEGVSSAEFLGTSGRRLNDCIATKAASVLPGFLSSAHTVAIGIGETIDTMSRQLAQTPLPHEILILPAIGTTTTTRSEMQSNIIVDNISSAFATSRYFTNVPIVIDSAESESDLFAHRYQELVSHWNEVDTVVMGLGVPYRSEADRFTLNEATDEYRGLVARSGSVGDVLTTYFRADGSEIELGENFMRNAISIQRLHDIDRVLCIAGGHDKVRGIHTALKSGLANCLVTDSMTASEIIRLEEA